MIMHHEIRFSINLILDTWDLTINVFMHVNRKKGKDGRKESREGRRGR